MRLHALALSAFGSFGGTEHVDFDRLSSGGVFLLHGPTGAGKTTILDAVSFALFGSVAGVRAAGESLRSHHAPAEIATEVRLEVTLDGRRYRIVRRPKQVRPKVRGEGHTTHPASATIEELVAGTWVARASRPTEADPFLRRHLHMEADQFHQIVMLPQGEFARFLRASADDRRQALEELFATHRFTELERWLRSQADAARAAVHQADEHVRRALVAAATVAGVDPFADDRALDSAPAWAAELAEAADAAAATTLAAERHKRSAHEEARRVLEAAVELRARQRRHAEAVARGRELADQAEAHAARRHCRDDAMRARAVVPLINVAERATAEAQRARSAADGAAATLRELSPALIAFEPGQLAEHHERLVAELAAVSELEADEHDLDGRRHQLDADDDLIGTLGGQLAELERTRETIPAAQAALDAQLRVALEAGARVDGFATQLAHLDAQVAAAAERDQRRAAVDDLAARHDARRRAELDGREQHLLLVARQLDGRAALLAHTLVDGSPCPVCGSPEHPAPALGDAILVSDAEVEAAAAAADAQAEAARTSAADLADQRRLLAACEATAGDAPVAELIVARQTSAEALDELRRQAEALPELTTQREALDQQVARLATTATAAATELRALGEQRAALHAGIVADQRRVDAALGGCASLAERAHMLTAERDAVAAVAASRQRLDAALDADTRAAADAADAATSEGFADVVEARAAALPDTELAALADRIEADERALAEVAAVVGDPELLEATARPAVELASVETAAADAERLWDLASTEAAAARRTAGDLHRHRAEVEARLTALGPLVDEAERTRRLADLATGDDRRVAHRMRLSTYVLAARLEQVAAAASVRLQRMSGGRFTIVHTDEAPDGRRKGGLGLRVVDAWTSTERETTTLSGGESFFTSLALALGVADIVCAEAGGVQIDTMFIDEGFGSLDDTTLHEVLDVIDGLRAGGRTIGVVSHVADLRTRISTQLEIQKGASGSTIRAVTSGTGTGAAPLEDAVLRVADHGPEPLATDPSAA